MPCDALVCKREADCGDTSCPGHPKGVAAYLDEMDRQSAAHHAAMSRKLPKAGGCRPREAGQSKTPLQLGPPEWVAIGFCTAIALCLVIYLIALARIFQII